jgi:hypothetical protein
VAAAATRSFFRKQHNKRQTQGGTARFASARAQVDFVYDALEDFYI